MVVQIPVNNDWGMGFMRGIVGGSLDTIAIVM